MRLCFDVDELRAEPSGCVAGAGWIYFKWSAALSGLVFFGRPDQSAAQALARSLELEFEPGVDAHAFYVDARRLGAIDPDAFAALFAVYEQRRGAKVYSRLALVVPAGMDGAVVAGFHGGLMPDFPARAFTSTSEALGWLDAPAGVDETLAQHVAAQVQAPPIVVALRTLLARDSAPSEADEIGAALGLSTRTLQRRLSEAGTTLQREVTRARIEVAKRRLADASTPITVIALDLGFATSQHFSRIFRAATGMAPTEWRAKTKK